MEQNVRFQFPYMNSINKIQKQRLILSLIHIQMCIRDRFIVPPNIGQQVSANIISWCVSVLFRVSRSLCVCRSFNKPVRTGILFVYGSFLKPVRAGVWLLFCGHTAFLSIVLLLSLIHIQMCIRDRRVCLRNRKKEPKSDL